jgi:peptide-methionine (S)-S-oxide reductase
MGFKGVGGALMLALRECGGGRQVAQMETATLAGGCFWCVEAVFDAVRGVHSVESGYTGGHTPKPDYKSVCAGTTGHAEAIRIEFDPAEVSYADLLDIFFTVHDPTQLNRQGNDVGTQYRSAIFIHSAEQGQEAEAAIARAAALWPGRIVTEVTTAGVWHPAEAEHQEYYERVGDANPYCSFVVSPKVAKFRKTFAHRLKG